MISGIILASGFSRRMGKNKLLLKFNGKTIIENVVFNSICSLIDEIIVVTQYDEVIEIFKNTNLKTVKNDNAELGLSNSIVLGVKASSINTDGYLIMLGDMPFLKSEDLNKIIENFEVSENSIIVPICSGNQKNPVLFPSLFRDDLINLKGDKGGKEILKRNESCIKRVNFDNESIFKDIDTEYDYKEVLVDEHF